MTRPAHRNLTADQQKVLDRILLQAIRRWDTDIIKSSVEAGADTQQLMPAAIQKKNLDMLKLAVENGADVQKLSAGGDNNFVSALHLAHDNYSEDTIRYLLQEGLKIGQKNFAGDTVVLRAMRGGDFDKMKFYLQQGAELGSGVQELMFSAIARKDLDMIKWSIAEGADINAAIKVSSSYVSAFHIVCDNFRADIAEFFLSQGVSVDVPNAAGDTVLMMSARRADLEKVKFYLSHGADPIAQNHGGLTALDEVQKYIDAANYRDNTVAGREVLRLLLEETRKRYSSAFSPAALRRDLPAPKPINSKPPKIDPPQP